MESRKSPPDLQILDLVTANNIDSRMAEIEQALNLRKDALLPILRADNELTLLNDELEKSFSARVNRLDHLIINAAATDEDDARIADFMETKRTALKGQLEPFYLKLKEKQKALVKAHHDDIQKARDTLINHQDFHAGNHAIALRILKKNIAITLQKAAQYIYDNQIAFHTAPKIFNTVFIDVSFIDKDGKIHHDNACPDAFAINELHELQQQLTGILEKSSLVIEPVIINDIKRHLLSLNHTSNNEIINNHPVLEINSNEHLQFTKELYGIEEKTHRATAEAKKMLVELDRKSEAKLDDFENDPTFKASSSKLIEAIFEAESDINHFKTTIVNEDIAKHTPNSPAAPAKPPVNLVAVAEPASLPAAPALKFWQKPLFKKVMIGAAIGLGVTVLAAGITAAIFFSGGAAGAAIGAAATFLIAKISLGGAIGCVLGLAGLTTLTGALIGAGVQRHVGKPPSPAAPAPAPASSSTANVLREVRDTNAAPVVVTAPAAPVKPVTSTTNVPPVTPALQPTADLPRLK